MATRSRSTSSRLAFGNPKPRDSHVPGITDALDAVCVSDLIFPHPVRWDIPPISMSIPLDEKFVGFVVLVNQSRRGSRKGSGKESKNSPFVDADIQSEVLRPETSPRAPS